MHQSSGSVVDAPRATASVARRRSGAPVRLLLEVPDRLPVVLGCLTLCALVATIAGQFRPVVVVPAWAVLVVVTWRLVPAAPRAQTSARPVLALLALVGAWSAWGVAESGEYVVVNRDPGFLTLKAWWLVGHSSARVPVGTAVQAAVGGASAQTDGFSVHGDALLAQGNSALPALLATVGWAGGPAAVLWANVLVGAVALVAVYAVARRLVAPGWALAATAGVAVALPMLAFTRSAYTEPLVLALTFGGVALLLAVLERPSRGGFALVGGLVGLAAAARIDGAMVIDGAALALACVVLAARAPEERRRLARRSAVAVAVMTLVALLGLVDLVLLSPSYFSALHHELTLLLGATAVVLVAVAAVLGSPLRDALPRWLAGHRRTVFTVGQLLVALGFVVLATRPWWLTVHGNDPAGGVAGVVAGIQRAEGLPLDGTRSYDEQTVTWLAWYLGWPAVLASVVGAVMLVRRAVARRDVRSAVVLAVVAVAATPYLLAPSITPDQVWAVRRLLPAALPGAVLFAVLALAAAWARRGWRWRLPAALVGLSMVAVPVFTWFPLAARPELGGQLGLIESTCDALDRAGVSRVVWVKSAPWKYLATLRLVCDVDTVEFTDRPTQGQLAQVAAAWDDEPVLVLSNDAGQLGYDADVAPLVAPVTSTEWGRSLSGPPRSTVVRGQGVWAGVLGEDGSLTPLTAADVPG